MRDWLERDVMITVKAYPNPSRKYQEIVCSAGVTREEGWIRLFPIRFRDLPDDKAFSKYQILRLKMTRATSDPRPESYTPDIRSIKMSDYFDSSQDGWLSRYELYYPPTYWRDLGIPILENPDLT